MREQEHEAFAEFVFGGVGGTAGAFGGVLYEGPAYVDGFAHFDDVLGDRTVECDVPSRCGLALA